MNSIKLVAIAKDEALYLPAWIFHHLYIGIDEIDIYLNGITDNSFELLRRISSQERRIKIFNANRILKLAIKSQMSFQATIYNFALDSEKSKQKHSHLLFLDIDEYLMPARFGEKIHKLLTREGESDAISFLWYSDLPSKKRKSFTNPMQRLIYLQKMTQMKSLCRLSGSAVKSNLHSFVFKPCDGQSINHVLSDGSSANFNENNEKRISITNDLNITSSIEPWFVYHQIFRSHNEYCATLMKGRIHRPKDKPIKDNRYGYCIHSDEIEKGRFIGDKQKYRVPYWRYLLYSLQYAIFTRATGVNSLIEESKKSSYRRYKKLSKLLKKRPDLSYRFEKQLRGTRFHIPGD